MVASTSGFSAPDSSSANPSFQDRVASVSSRSSARTSTSPTVSPSGMATTKCSRASTDSVTRAVKSIVEPPTRSSRMSCILLRTAVV